MALSSPPGAASPWRGLFEKVRRAAGNARDDHGVQGSINWLRKQMELRGANPNVVRNIIYRDKGRLDDKQALFAILAELWERSGHPPLRAPEVEVLLARPENPEAELLHLLGREKRRAYQRFVSEIGGGGLPRMLVTGRPGSGKTMLMDYVQESLGATLEDDALVRLEFGSGRLSASLVKLGLALGVPAATLEGKLAKIAASSAFAVQADAQAEVARTLLEAARTFEGTLVLLAHVSRPLSPEEGLGGTPLRLNTPEVPRVTMPEWLWVTLFEPMSRLPHLALLVSMTDIPPRVAASAGAFGEPVRLSPPTRTDARRFVRARLPHFDPAAQEEVVSRAGRSYEELRTSTLLAELRAPLPENGKPKGSDCEQHLAHLCSLAEGAGDERLRDFLTALAVLSLPEFPAFGMDALRHVRITPGETSQVELAFLDPLPSSDHLYRPFSRRFVRMLRERLQVNGPTIFAQLSARAAEFHRVAATSDPVGEDAARYLHYLLQARDWTALAAWMESHGGQHALLRSLWESAVAELPPGPLLERIALQVATHLVRLGSYSHPHTVRALQVLAGSDCPGRRAWASLRRAEGAVLHGQVHLAERLVAESPPPDDALLEADVALVRASIARWRGHLEEAAMLIERDARKHLARGSGSSFNGRMTRARAALWAGLIAKDRGDLESALVEFESVPAGDELIDARVAFQRGDVLLSLGRFDEARSSLDRAVELARLSKALVPEQTRYLARRGTLHRKLGDLPRAMADFDSAESIVAASGCVGDELEREFWRARLGDEKALALLATGDFRTAILEWEQDIGIFERYARASGIDVGYRVLRSLLRLSAAYLFRTLGRPMRMPYGVPVEEVPPGPDLLHARHLLGRVRKVLQENPPGALRWTLRRESRLLSVLLAADAAEALTEARCSLLEANYPYHLAESHAHVALAALRSGDPELAAQAVQAAQRELQSVTQPGQRGDRGLEGWLSCLALQAELARGDQRAAAAVLARALSDDRLAGAHEDLLRVFGEGLEVAGRLDVLTASELSPVLGFEHSGIEARVRLPDALTAHWAALSRRRRA